MDGIARSQVLDLFTLAIADGAVSPEELALVHQKAKELGLGAQQMDEVIRNPHRVAFKAPTSLVDALTRLYDLATVLVSDGVVDPREVTVLRHFVGRFGIREEVVDQTVAALIDEARAGTSRDAFVAGLSMEVGS